MHRNVDSLLSITLDNLFHHRAAHPTQTRAARLILSAMPPHQRSQSLLREGRIDLAIQSLKSKPHQSIRALALAYNVPRSTLQTRLHGIQSKHETTSVNLKLSPIEKQSLVQWILDLDQRRFPPQIIDVRRMGDVLLAARDQDPPPPPLGQK